MTDTTALPYYHTIGIGAGPANLSLAALHMTSSDEPMALFDRTPAPDWHATLLHPGVRMQTSWLKDLVSVVDPTHQLTFLNYLVTEGRLFALLNAQFDVIPRREYMRYLAWASRRIDNIHYGVDIDSIGITDGGFEVRSGGTPLARSEHLTIGVGTRPSTPAWAASLPDDRAFLADYLAQHLGTMRRDAPVAVVGGGQTGIEAVLRLLGAGFTDISWLGRRQWFMTIDDSPAANDFYRPAHQRFLQQLTRESRRRLITEQNPTGDALTPGALKVLYQANYDAMLERDLFPVTLLPARDVNAAEQVGDDIVLTATTPERREQHRVRHVVIAVGRETVPVPFDDDLRERLDTDEAGDMLIDADYSVRWKGMNGHRIYALNRGRMSHGIPDANLTLLPVRAAIVLNSMFERQLFEIKDDLCPIQWG
ncbi:MAG TPA: SidA/IucD/PvdA family monooxygenase [Kribbellaceae bacterium]